MSSRAQKLIGAGLFVLFLILIFQYEACNKNNQIAQKLKQNHPALYDSLSEQVEEENDEEQAAREQSVISHGTE